jgi:hypothetical protein
MRSPQQTTDSDCAGGSFAKWGHPPCRSSSGSTDESNRRTKAKRRRRFRSATAIETFVIGAIDKPQRWLQALGYKVQTRWIVFAAAYLVNKLVNA